jgi:hypothetical protein
MVVPASRVSKNFAYPCENAGRMQARQLSGPGRFDAGGAGCNFACDFGRRFACHLASPANDGFIGTTDSQERVMAPNMALKRAAKANRRKAVIAGKRKTELVDSSPAVQIARAAQMPIQHCFVSERLFDLGLGTLVLARGETSNHLAVGVFLIDASSFGVKDTFFRTMGARAFEDLVAKVEATGAPKSIDPANARKLLLDGAAWAASNGIAPHCDFVAIEKLFGDVDADGSDMIFQFGYMVRPDSRVQVVREAGMIGNALTVVTQE